MYSIDIQTDRQKQTNRKRKIEKCKAALILLVLYKQNTTQTEAYTHTDRQTVRQKETDRKTDKCIIPYYSRPYNSCTLYKQKTTQTDRQKYTYIETDGQTERNG